MLLSYNWLKELSGCEYSPEETESILTKLGIEVEGIIDYKKKYAHFYVASVDKAEKHPDADKLTICEVSTGDDVRAVICGAANVAAGQKAILGIPGAVMPQGGFMLERRKIRKVESEGMLCSKFELELGDDKSGIWVLPEDAPVGVSIADYFNLNDIVYEISLTPNKSDCLSHFGIAREIAAYAGNRLCKKPVGIKESGNNINESGEIIIEDEENCLRYCARVVRNIEVAESPFWLQSRLRMCGMRPLNVVVDLTNYVLLEYGQPLHAFDIDTLEGRKIIVRPAVEGEKFTTLDGKDRALSSDMLMICDGAKSIAIAGVMGGANSEISDATKNILIESAFFNPTSVRKTAKRLGISSEASYRFERGVDIENVEYAADRAAALIVELTGGTIDTGIIDIYPGRKPRLQLELRFQRTRDILGTDVSDDSIKSIMHKLGFDIISENSYAVTVEVPYWRVDVSQEIDLIEEVARHGIYDKIEPDFFSSINFGGEGVHQSLAAPSRRMELRRFLAMSGYSEIISQNMIDPASARLFSDKTIKIANPLGEELSIMRPSLIPSMMKQIALNLRHGNNELHFFEIGKSFHTAKEEGLFIEGIKERENLLISICGSREALNWSEKPEPADYFDIKGIVESIFDFFKLKEIHFEAGKSPNNIFINIFSENMLGIFNGFKQIGIFGEISPKYLKTFDISVPVFVAELDLSAFYSIEIAKPRYQSVPLYPAIKRDLGFVLGRQIKSEDVMKDIFRAGGELLRKVEIFDVYEGAAIGEDNRNIAFSLVFNSSDKTLTDAEIEPSVSKIVRAVERNFGGILRKF